MVQSLAAKTVEGASGVTIALPFHLDSETNYYYPLVQIVPTELGGLSIHHLEGAASVNATVVKTSAGQVYGVSIGSIDATPVVLRFYDVATTPTMGTTTIKFTVVCDGAATTGKHIYESFPMGVLFGTGIAYTLSTAMDDAASSGSLTADEVHLNIFYK